MNNGDLKFATYTNHSIVDGRIILSLESFKQLFKNIFSWNMH